MNRTIIIVSTLVAVVTGVGGYYAVPGLLSDAFESSRYFDHQIVFQIAFALMASAAGLVLTISVVGIFLSVKLAAINTNLSDLAAKARKTGHITDRQFFQCFEDVESFTAPARKMTEEAWIKEAPEKNARTRKLAAFSSNADTALHKEVLARHLYPAGVLSMFAWVLIAGAPVVVATVLGSLAIHSDQGQLFTGLAAAAGVVVAGFLVLVASEALDRWLHDRLTEIFAAIDKVLPIADGRSHSPASQAILSRLAPDPAKEAVEAMSQSIEERLSTMQDELKAAIETSNKNLSKSISTAVQNALSKPMRELSTSTRELTKEQSAHVGKVVDNAVRQFNSQMDKQLGKSLKELGNMLSDVAALTKKLEGQIKETINTVTKELDTGAKAANKQYVQTLTELSKSMKEQNKAWAGELKGVVDDLATQIRDGREEHRASLNNSAQSISQTGSDIRASADSFEALKDTLDSLVGLAAPILRQTIQNQEKLLKALESESSASQVIERAASDMHAASEASRETLEHFLGLAERLTEASRAIRGTGGGGRGQRGARQPHLRDESFTEAVRELREMTMQAQKDLPDIGER